MKLIDLIRSLHEVDEDAIIFQEDKSDVNSEIILSYAEEGDMGIKVQAGKNYYYMIEVFLAKEFVQDWIASLDYNPSSDDIAMRLYSYIINDA